MKSLCEVLKGHEGEIFYSISHGPVKLVFANKIEGIQVECDGKHIRLTADGKLGINGELNLFPSKDQRDWNKWHPKVWEELTEVPVMGVAIGAEVSIGEYAVKEDTFLDSPIERSALAFMKISQLIGVGYGGNITTEESWNRELKYHIGYYFGDGIKKATYVVYSGLTNHNPLRFRTKELAEEFLSYPKNIELLNDFFMI